MIEANSNRLMGVGNAAQQLDANGNLLNDGKFLYTYNAQNRLANVDGIYHYTYNADNQRVQKTTPQGTTLYAWANGRIIGEYDQSGTAKQETVYMGTTPIATIQQGKVYRIYADQLDTPRVITDENGKTLWRWDSSPFGETAANEDADGDGIALNYNPRFPGQLYDAETGLHYNYHRDYNPETGRYVQSDPIGLAGGLNTFGYAYQSPYGYVDPSGWDSIGWEQMPKMEGIYPPRHFFDPSAYNTLPGYGAPLPAFSEVLPALAGIIAPELLVARLATSLSAGSGLVGSAGQLTKNACGMACGQKLLSEQGINVFQSNLAKGFYKGLTPEKLGENLNRFQTGWKGFMADLTQKDIVGLYSVYGKYIARTGGNPGHFVTVESVANRVVKFWDPSGGIMRSKSVEEFTDIATGVVFKDK